METTPTLLRQHRVLLMYIFRFSNTEIAKDIGRSKSTVKKDLKIIYQRFGVQCLAMALVMALINEEITLADLRCFYSTLNRVNN